MNILYVCRSRLQSRDANAVHVLHMTHALAGLGHKVDVVAAQPPEANSRDLPGLRWHTSELDGRLLGWAGVPLLARRITKGTSRPDVIFTRHLPSAAMLGKRSIPMIVELHALQEGRLGRWLEAAALRSPSLARVIAISEPLRADLLARHSHLCPALVHVLHDAATLADKPSQPALERQRPVLQIGYVGSLYPGKGAEMTMRLAAELPQFDFHIVGGTREECVAIFGGLLPANVQTHGHWPHVDLARIYASLDVGLVPISDTVRDRDGNDIGRWTSPLKLFEYLAAGLAVVASDVPSLREVLAPDQEALFAPPDQIESWVTALKRLGEDERLRSALAKRGRQLVERKHTWHARAQDALSGIGAAE